ncbi:MAG: hypothetical protein JWN70_1764 [Planctomycetaceae bacterium]|nr:hypothetical protein [Planctomycetaceae bacterium]
MIIPHVSFVHSLPRLLLILSAMTLGGCGGTEEKPRGKVAVTVTFDGTPVTEGQVNLQSTTTGEGGGGALNGSGVAEIPNVAEGSYIVTVTPPIVIVAPTEPGKGPPPPKEFANIPEKFRKMDTSPLKADIVDTANDYSFDLKK